MSGPRRSRPFLGKREACRCEGGVEAMSPSERKREREDTSWGGVGEVVSRGSRLTDKRKTGKWGWNRISKGLCRPCLGA